MIKVDLHVHTSHSVDGSISPEKLVDLSQTKGLGALAITDHNTIGGALAVRKITPFPVIVGDVIEVPIIYSYRDCRRMILIQALLKYIQSSVAVLPDTF